MSGEREVDPMPDPPAAEPPALVTLGERIAIDARNAAYSRVLKKIEEMRLALHGGTPAWSFDAEEELDELQRAVEALQKEK